MLRVIAGEAKGRRLQAPDLPGLRPTSERVREAMFDILEARRLVVDAHVIDLFSGSGALGIEALSRGAAAVSFVEQDRRAIAAIEHNLEVTGYRAAAGVKVVRAEVMGFLRGGAGSGADLVLADPPYGFDGWEELLGLTGSAVVLVEHRGPLGATGGYAVSREYRYGGTLVTLLQAAQPAPEARGAAGAAHRTDPDLPGPHSAHRPKDSA